MTSAFSTTASTWVAIDVAKLVHQVLIDGRAGRRRTMRIANTASEIERLVTHL
jgi:transposase